MGRFLKKYEDYIFPIFMLVCFLVFFIIHLKTLEKCTTWDKTAFESLAGCINCGWATIVWLLDIKQITDNRRFDEIKKLLGERR
jgi:hypothetical protein